MISGFSNPGTFCKKQSKPQLRTILTMFQYWEPLRRRKKGVGVQRDEEAEERNIKIRVKGKCVFSCMCFLMGCVEK